MGVKSLIENILNPRAFYTQLLYINFSLVINY